MYYVTIPREFLKLHKYVNLVADVMLVNNIPFLVSMYFSIRSINVGHVPTRAANNLSKSLKIIMYFYSRGSMIVKTM